MATSSSIDPFEQFVDALVCAIVEQGDTSFHTIVLALPSVDPSAVLCSLQRLVAMGRLAPGILEAAHKEIQRPHTPPARQLPTRLPIPHPLDYEWRFSADGISLMLHHCQEFSGPQDTVAMLGVPSVFEEALRRPGYDRRLLLIDGNASATRYLAQVAPPHEVAYCDLLHGQVPAATAKIAIIDAPWYPPFLEAFLRAAAQICSLDGYALMSVPPPGTRPGIAREWKGMVRKARRMGFQLVSYYPLALPYISPPFERNALRAAGITDYPADWRRGDLAVFSRIEQSAALPPQVLCDSDKWAEYSWPGIRIRVRVREKQGGAGIDPTLVSIVPGDILPSVSRRDNRRPLADVWTSGNRIFRCANTRMLGCILAALSEHREPTADIAATFQRELSHYEITLVTRAQDQVQQLISIERNETAV